MALKASQSCLLHMVDEAALDEAAEEGKQREGGSVSSLFPSKERFGTFSFPVVGYGSSDGIVEVDMKISVGAPATRISSYRGGRRGTETS